MKISASGFEVVLVEDVVNVEDEALVTKSVSRRTFEAVADGDRHDSQYARQVLENRAKRRLSKSL